MSTYGRLLRYVLPYWKRVVLLFIIITIFASLSGVSLTLIPPFLKILLAGETVETVAPSNVSSQGLPLPASVERVKTAAIKKVEGYIYSGGPRERLLRFCRLLILLLLLKNLFGYFNTYLTEYLEQKVLYRIRRQIYGHVHNLPLSFFDRERSGHVISKLTNDVTMLRGAVIGVAASVIRNLFLAMISLIIILLISWKLTLLTFIIVPINIALVGIIGVRLKKRSHRAQEGMADMTANLDEAIGGIRVVKAFNEGDYEKDRFDKYSQRHMMQYIKMKLWGALSSPTSEMLGALSFVVILWYGGGQVIDGSMPGENLVLFVGAMLFVVSPVKELSKLNNVVQQSLAAAQRVFDLLDIDEEPLGQGGEPVTFEHEIVFDHVTFEYNPGTPVLRDVSFSVKPGEVVAIVGPSGAGKTTLVDLVPRFYTPTSGSISFDGKDTEQLDLSSLRELLGIVTQETILFNDTIRNNIAYGRRDYSDEAVEEAAKAANAHNFIVSFTDGYNTIVGDRGAQLSGGQRQRIAIARALLRDPAILIFDEATSALDSESEALVQQAIDRLLEGRTTFVIAHRLSTIQHADKILVLEDGRLKQLGTHEELLDQHGVYRRLYELQFRAAG